MLEATHPRLWQVRVFLVKQWTWNAIQRSLPEGYTRFNVDLIHDRRPLHPFRALMSITEEDVLKLEYVIKELRVPSPRTRRDIAEAISRHQSDLIYELLCKYKVPELVKVMRGETISPVSLLLWTLYPTIHCWRLAVHPTYVGNLPERHCQLLWPPTTLSRWRSYLHVRLTLTSPLLELSHRCVSLFDINGGT